MKKKSCKISAEPNFFTRLKYAEKKVFASYKFYNSDNFDKLIECLTASKNEKLILDNELVEHYKNLKEEFEQNGFARTAKGNCKFGHDCISLLKWIVLHR